MSRRARPWYRGGRSMWYVTVKGQQVPLGVTDPNDQAAAEEAFRRLVEETAAKVAARVHRPAAADPAIAGPTVSEAVAAFLADREKRVAAGKLSPGGLANYRLAMRHFEDAFGPRPIHSLTAEDLQAWVERPEWSPSYQATTLGQAIACLRWHKIAIVIPLADRPARESRGAEVALSDEQFAQVLAALRKYRNAGGDLPELLQALRESGARPQELAQARVETIDWANACTRLEKHKTRRKTKTVRVIHFNSAAMAVLERQREKYPTGFLFRTRTGGPYTPKAIVRRMLAVSKRVGFRAIAYGTRHSFATKALVAGIPDSLVAELLGQKGTAMLTFHYSHLGDKARELKAAAEKVSQRAG